MKNSALLLSAFLVVASLLGGCGHDDSSGGSGTCAQGASQVCDKIAECSEFVLDFTYADKDDCVTQLTRKCEQATQAPGSKTTASYFADCSSRITCDSLTGDDSVCAPVPGSSAVGAACYSDVQCQSNHCQLGTDDCGTCQNFAKEGEACDKTQCGDGLLCTNSVCLKSSLATEGQSCADANCAAGLTCGADDTCKKPGTKKSGDPCTSNDDCAQIQGLYCASTKTCALIALVGVGESCGSGSLALCKGGNSCDSDTNKCVAALNEGDSCTVANFAPDLCGHGARCDGTKCTFDAPTCK